MELFRLLGTIAVQNNEAIKGINDTTEEAEKAESKMSKAFKNIGDKATQMGQKMSKVSLAAGAAFSGIVAGITKTYADYEQLSGGVETLFKDSSDKVLEYANNAYKTAGLSANAYMETVTSFSASLLQSLGGDTEKAAKYADRAIIDMSDNANKMGTSMEMIQNAYQGFAKQNYTMLDNLKLGYGGTQEEMKRLIQDAAALTDVQAELGVTVDENSMSFGNIVNAISVMQTEMGIAGTTTEEAEKTISGSWNALKGAWTNFMTEFGKAGADMDKVYEQLEESAKNFASNIGKLIGRVFENSPFLVIGAALLGLLAIMSPVLIAFGSLMTGIGAIIPLLPKITAGFSALSKAMLANPIGLVIATITALVAAFIYLWNNCEGFREFWINLWKKIKETALEAKEKLVNMFTAVIDFFKNNWKELLLLIVNPFAGAFALLYKHNDKFRAKVDALKTAVVNIWGKIKDGIVSKIQTARDKIKAAIDKIKSFFNITLKFKKLKMPHIEISWNKKGVFAKAAKYIGLDGIPKFNVAWYKQGAIFDKPTLFATPYGIKGVGEAGAEAVTPIDKLQDYVSTAVASQNEAVVYYLQKMTEIMADYFPQVVDGLDRPLAFDADGMANALAVPMDKYLGRIKERKDRGR